MAGELAGGRADWQGSGGGGVEISWRSVSVPLCLGVAFKNLRCASGWWPDSWTPVLRVPPVLSPPVLGCLPLVLHQLLKTSNSRFDILLSIYVFSDKQQYRWRIEMGRKARLKLKQSKKGFSGTI